MMGKDTIDFNYIFFGRHERKRRILMLIIIYLVAGAVLYYGYKPIESTISQESKEKTNDDLSRELAQRNVERSPSVVRTDLPEGYSKNLKQTSIEVLCSGFTKVKDEVSCKDATNLALKNYSGYINSVNESKEQFLAGNISIEKKIWIIGVDLELPIKLPSLGIQREGETSKVQIAVDKISGNLWVYSVV